MIRVLKTINLSSILMLLAMLCVANPCQAQGIELMALSTNSPKIDEDVQPRLVVGHLDKSMVELHDLSESPFSKTHLTIDDG